MRLSALALLLMSCVDKETEDTAPAAESCTTTLLSAEPAANSTAAPLTAAPSVALSASDPSATLLIMASTGAPVDGVLTTEGSTLTFAPAAPLTTASAYTATVTWCEGDASAVIPFTTTAGDLVGKTYRIPVGDLNFDELDAFMHLMVFTVRTDLLVQITEQPASNLYLRMATTSGTLGPQDTCLETQMHYNVDFMADPRLVTAPQTYRFSSLEGSVPLASMQIDATVSPGGASLHHVRVTGDIDIRDAASGLADIVGTEDPILLCAYLAGLDLRCLPCLSDGESVCLPVQSEEGIALLEADTSVDCVRSDSCHPDCATSTCEDPRDGVCN